MLATALTNTFVILTILFLQCIKLNDLQERYTEGTIEFLTKATLALFNILKFFLQNDHRAIFDLEFDVHLLSDIDTDRSNSRTTTKKIKRREKDNECFRRYG